MPASLANPSYIYLVGGRLGKIKFILLLVLLPLFAKANIEIIYTWSTMMPLSIEGIIDVEQLCYKYDFQCTFVFDPFLSVESLDTELTPYAQTQYLSDELVHLGILNHFPGFAVLDDGVVQGNIHLGYLEPQTLEAVILGRLK